MGVLGQPGKEWEYLMQEVRKKRVALVRAAIIDKYGFCPSEVYCEDLIAFMEALSEPLEEAPNVQRE